MDPPLTLIIGIILGLALILLLRFSIKDGKPGPKIIFWVIGVILAIGIGLYALLNEGGIEPTPPPEPSPADREFADAVSQLEDYLKDNPDNAEAWATLGGGYSSLGRFSDAVVAYLKAARLEPENPNHHAAIGEALTLANDGSVSEDAKVAFEAALALNPLNEIANFYLGDYDYAAGNIEGAYNRWIILYEGLDPNTPWINLVEQRLEKAAADLGLSPPPFKGFASGTDDDLASLSQEEQDQMIADMVSRLEARMADNPDDLEGWFRLGQSYMVLGREAEAAEALFHLVEARPDDPAALSFYLQARLIDLEKKESPLPEEIISQLTRLEGLNPNDTTALYYLGVAALQNGDKEGARTFWQRLLVQFPPGSNEALFVKEKLEQLDENAP